MEEEPMPYAVLGLHGVDVETVNKITEVTNADGAIEQLVEERNIARVRMFVDDQMIDEDFDLPRLITVEEQIDAAVTARIAEIRVKGTDPKLSEIVGEQPEQIVEDIT